MDIRLVPLDVHDIDEQYVSWHQNSDGHLDYFTGTGRSFDRDILISDYENGLMSGRWYYYLIVGDNGDRIGNIKIGPIDQRNKTSDLVCLVGNRQYLGQGIASRAIKMANEIAFKKFDIRRLQGGMYASNIASVKAYTKAGWIVEATLRGYYWINNNAEDRVCVACLNPHYFPEME